MDENGVNWVSACSALYTRLLIAHRTFDDGDSPADGSRTTLVFTLISALMAVSRSRPHLDSAQVSAVLDLSSSLVFRASMFLFRT